jgi:hypothetical protein
MNCSQTVGRDELEMLSSWISLFFDFFFISNI